MRWVSHVSSARQAPWVAGELMMNLYALIVQDQMLFERVPPLSDIRNRDR